jgi:hypothetical protein
VINNASTPDEVAKSRMDLERLRSEGLQYLHASIPGDGVRCTPQVHRQRYEVGLNQLTCRWSSRRSLNLQST